LVNDVRPATFVDGEILFQEGDRGDKLFFIRSGELELLQGGQLVETLKPGQAVGDLELLTRTARTETARAKGEVRTLFLCFEDLTRWRQMCPELDQALRKLASQRLNELREHQHRQHAEAETWATQAIAALSAGRVVPTPAEIQEMRAQHSGAPLAVWLGLLLDGIPESVVIGTGLVALVSMRLTVSESISFHEVASDR
jgi:CRP-like cAMP-binding protein